MKILIDADAGPVKEITVREAKKRIPDVKLTSDVIVGFPGETYEDFKETLSLIKEVEFESLFTFIYSPRGGTPAAKMPDPISRETKTLNAYGYQRGDLRGMPQWCITVGMKQILDAEEIYIALNRPWQHGIVKRVLYDKVQAAIPASLLQHHKNVTFCTYEEVAEGLF